jgi:hypothetical protein
MAAAMIRNIRGTSLALPAEKAASEPAQGADPTAGQRQVPRGGDDLAARVRFENSTNQFEILGAWPSLELMRRSDDPAESRGRISEPVAGAITTDMFARFRLAV